MSDGEKVSMRAGPDGVTLTREPEVTPARPRSWSPVQQTIEPTLRFASVVMTPDQLDRAARVRNGFITLLELIEECTPVGRERALVTTHLEDAAMWATKAISRERRE